MTENKDNVQVSALDSKFTRVALIVVSVLLIFVGATYVPYLMADILKMDYVASVAAGGLLFIVGLVMLVFLIRKKVVE